MKLVCVTKGFQNFTYGKIYDATIYSNSHPVLDIINDLGEKGSPMMYGVLLDKEQRGLKIDYFITIEQWRENQINQVIDGN
jgi:hypothetical protein